MKITEQQIDEITAYWNEGVAVQAICEMVGLRPRHFEELRKTCLRHLTPRGKGYGGGKWRRGVKDPTAAEIQERIKQVQARWTAEDRASRFVGSAVYHTEKDVSLQEERARTLPDPRR